MTNTSYSTPTSGQSSTMQQYGSGQPSAQNALDHAMDYFHCYARENPETVALWCLGIGFVLGWKLKPW